MNAGVKSTELNAASTFDAVIANRNGTTVLVDIVRLIATVATLIGPSYATRTELYADLSWPDGSVGSVFDDPTTSRIGTYKKSGASGSGSWARIGDLPSSGLSLSALALKAPLNNPTFTGVVSGITKAMVGLDNANNTADADKPVSGPQQTQLDTKLPTSAFTALFTPLAPETGYAGAIMTGVPGYPWMGFRLDGSTVIFNLDAESIRNPIANLLPQELPPESGYIFGIGDTFPGRFPFLIAVDGGVRLTLKELIGQVVAVSNLTPDTASQLMPNTADRVPVKPGRWRSRRGPVALTTHARDGSLWTAFPDVPVRLLRGANGSGQSLHVRKSNGVLMQGTAYVGTFSPGAYPSTNLRGQLPGPAVSNPAGTFSAGDYYQYTNGAGDVSTGTNAGMNVGDLLVYDGAAWRIQAGPGTFGARFEGDWWRLSAGGTFDGVVYASGDAILYHGRQTGGGGWQYERWAKVNGLVYRGEFDPTAGLPGSPVNGEVYQASVVGTATFTFAVGDMLIREDGAWVHIPTDTVTTYASAASMALRCVASADEWEVRRADKSATIVGLSLSADQERGARAPKREIRIAGDSMPGQAALSTAMGSLMASRTFVQQSYGGATARQVRGMVDYAIMNGDAYAGDVLMPWIGQNNQPSAVGDANWCQTVEALQAMQAMAGARDIRIAPLTIAGQRAFDAYTGGRLTCAQQEGQLAGTSVLAQQNAATELMFPQSLNVWRTLRAAAMANMGAVPSVHFPGMTEAQVAETYGILPLAWMASGVLPLVPADMSFQGTVTGGTLPTGGSDGHYYIRTDGSSQTERGNLAIKVGGTWQWFSWDRTHIGSAGGIYLGAAGAAKLIEWSW